MKRIINIKFWACLSLILLNIDVNGQNTGPTLPDFYGFEPMEATDMVNVMTGDLTYTMPIMHVPGPGGGYPIVLSYSAGVGVDQEATWVGMGWRLNTGGIHRRINGGPDDAVAINRTTVLKNGDHEFQTVSASFSSIGGWSVGVSASWGDYQSIGVSGGYGIFNASINSNGSVGVGVDPLSFFGDDVKDAATAAGLSTNVGLSLNTKNGQLGGSVSASINPWMTTNSGHKPGVPGLGVSMSVNDDGMSLTSSFMSNSLSNKNVSTSSSVSTISSRSGISLPIPIPGVGMFMLGYHKTQTNWTANQSNRTIQIGGMLPFQYASVTGVQPYDIYGRTYDNVSMDVNEFSFSEKLFDDPLDGLKKPSVLLPAADEFNVIGQGISFSMSNKYFETGMLSSYGSVAGARHKYFYGPAQLPYSPKGDYQKFVVNNSNSGNWIIDPGSPDDNISASDILSSDALTSFFYEDNPSVFHSRDNTTSEEKEYIDDIELYSKKHIEFFTNTQISTNGAGVNFIEANGFDNTVRTGLPSEGIGAYRITNEQGVVYHYSLPVYQGMVLSNDQEDTSDDSDINYFVSNTIADYKYASTWLLTAITGPDYVDINNNGPDDSDYGYWVTMDYGLLHDHYLWRSYKELAKSFSQPNENWSGFSTGFKEIYYLDKIKTATHTALFVKGERKDGFSTGANGFTSAVNGGGDRVYEADGKKIKLENFDNKVGHLMRLEHILLFKNDNMPSISQQSHSDTKYCKTCISDVPKIEWWNAAPLSLEKEYTVKYNQNQNIIDYKEYEAYQSSIEAKMIKKISLGYDYSITNGFYNSEATNKKKLTLTSIENYTTGNVRVLPPQKFSYYENYDIDNSGIASSFFSRKNNTDSWGYYSSSYTYDQAHNWSLKTIENPIGGKLEINYEGDKFRNEYALGDHIRTIVTDVNQISGNEYELKFPSEYGNFFAVNDIIKLKYDYIIHEDGFSDISNPSSDYFSGDKNFIVKITALSSNHKTMKIEILNDSGSYANTAVVSSVNAFFKKFVEEKVGYSKFTKYFSLEIIPENQPAITEMNGGGLRVSSIDLSDGVATYKSTYNYNTFGSHYTSGYTSFAPKDFYRKHYMPYAGLLPSPGVKYSNVSITKGSSESNTESTTEYEFNIPKYCTNCDDPDYKIPGFFDVTDLISENNQIDVVEGSNNRTHDFEGARYYKTNNNNKQYSGFNNRDVVIDNGFNRIGELVQLRRRNAFGQVFYKKTNDYADNISAKKVEGYYNRKIQHTRINAGFNTQNIDGNSMTIPDYTHYYNYFNTIVTYKETPRILSSVQTESQGITNKIWYEDYDLLLGNAKTIITENSFGDRNRAKSTHAYEVYPEMGPKSLNVNNKNMLTQQAASYLYFDNGDDDYTNDPVIDASITTWNKIWKYREFIDGQYLTSSFGPTEELHQNIWRKQTTYSWRNKLEQGTGAYLGADGELFNDDDEFKFDDLSLNSNKWVQNSEVTLYDHYSSPREVKDVNGQYASSKTWKGLTVSNIVGAAYSGYCASGAEELIQGQGYGQVDNPRYFETETKLGNTAELVNNNAHTGLKSVAVQGTHKKAFISTFVLKSSPNSGDQFNPTGYYTLSVWVKGTIGSSGIDKANYIELKVKQPSSTAYTTVTHPEIIQAGEWKQLRYTFQPTSSYIPANTTMEISIGSAGYSGPLYFDDYRLYPVGASMTSYVYDNQDRIEYILDGSNIGTKYKYDDKGRLEEIYTEKIGSDGGFVRTASSNMHFIRDNE